MPGRNKSFLFILKQKDNYEFKIVNNKSSKHTSCAALKRGDWAVHKLECSAMTAFGENWCPSETTRLVARILAVKVGH